MGGVVNLQSYDNLGERTGEMKLEGGDPYHQRLLDHAGQLRLARQIGPWSFMASGALSNSDGFVVSHDFKPTDDNHEFHEDGGLRAGSDYSKSMLMAKATYAPRAGLHVSAIGHAFFQDRGIPTFEGGGYTRYWRYTAYDTYLAGLVVDYRPEDVTSPWRFAGIETAVYASRHDDTIEDYQDDTFKELTTNPLAWFVASAYCNQSYGAVATPRWQLTDANKLLVSAAANYEANYQRTIPVSADHINDEWTPWETFSSTTFNLAAEDTHQIGPLRVTAGVGGNGMTLLAEEIRGTSYPVSHRVITAVDGRLFSDYEIFDDVRVLLAGGHKTRYPTLKELFSNVVGGNRDLDPEQAWMSEAGVDWRAPARVRLNGRLFYNAVRDLIDTRYNAYANVKRATIAGTELSAAWSPMTWLKLQGQYTYLYAHDDIEKRALDYRSPHSVGLDARVNAPWGTEAGVQGLYRSGQRAYSFDGISNEWQKDRLPGYVLVNAMVRHSVEFESPYAVSVFLRLRNIFDVNYVRGSFAPEPGRQIFAGLDLAF